MIEISLEQDNDLEIASYSATVEQPHGLELERDFQHVRMIEVVTDGAQLLEISGRTWKHMSHTDKLSFNAWTARYHDLKVEWAEQRVEVRERIDTIMADAWE